MAFTPLGTGVQHSDVDVARVGLRVARKEVFGNAALSVAGTVQRHTQVFESLSGGFVEPDFAHEVGQEPTTDDTAGGVVVPTQKSDLGPDGLEALHLLDEKQPALVITIRGIQEIAAQKQQGSSLGEASIDQAFERSASRELEGSKVVAFAAR